MAVRLSRIEEQVVYRAGGGQGSSKLVGSGFVYDDDGIEHGHDLRACILTTDGSECEDEVYIEVIQPGSDDKNNTNFRIKITVPRYPDNDPDYEFPDDFYGEKSVVIKKHLEELVLDERDGKYKCPADSPTCSILEKAIRIKPAAD